MQGHFITATGTDVGKTYLTAGLATCAHNISQPIRVIKPLISGFDPENPTDSDTHCLLAAQQLPFSAAMYRAISPFQFKAALSPNMAATLENKRIDAHTLIQHCLHESTTSKTPLFCEGVGGIMVPLNHKETVLDWMLGLRWPVILVCGSYLGSLSHTLTAVAVLEQQQIPIRCIVVSESENSSVCLQETRNTLQEHSRYPVFTLARQALEANLPCFAEILESLSIK